MTLARSDIKEDIEEQSEETGCEETPLGGGTPEGESDKGNCEKVEEKEEAEQDSTVTGREDLKTVSGKIRFSRERPIEDAIVEVRATLREIIERVRPLRFRQRVRARLREKKKQETAD